MEEEEEEEGGDVSLWFPRAKLRLGSMISTTKAAYMKADANASLAASVFST